MIPGLADRHGSHYLGEGKSTRFKAIPDVAGDELSLPVHDRQILAFFAQVLARKFTIRQKIQSARPLAAHGKLQQSF